VGESRESFNHEWLQTIHCRSLNEYTVKIGDVVKMNGAVGGGKKQDFLKTAKV